ncbi:MAG: COG1361 S-layer family protein [Nitrosotalea sp.]
MPKIISVALIVLLFAPSFSIPSSSAQIMQSTDCSAPLNTSIDTNYNGPVAIDAYWVDQGTSVGVANGTSSNVNKKEIGPGEGDEVFAVILNNRGPIEISSITGFLNLPAGFKPTGESQIPQLLQNYNPASKLASNYALASYYGYVGPGDTFVLYFDVNVSPTATVGLHPTNLVINFQIQENQGSVGALTLHCSSAELEVPLVLPGKVVMDLNSDSPNIEASKTSSMDLIIKNKGSANATGVVATITNLGNNKGGGSGSGSSLVLSSGTTNIINLGNNTFNLGNIPAGGNATISTSVFPSSAAAGTTEEVDVSVAYENAWGKSLSTSLTTGIVIAPLPPQSLSLTYLGNGTSPVITSGQLSNLNFVVTNNGTNDASNVVVSLVPQSTSVSVVGQSTWTIPHLAAGATQELSTNVFAADALIDTPTAFTLNANYVSEGETQTNSLTLGAFVVGDIQLQLYGLTVNYVGSAPNIAGTLLNKGSTTGLYTTIQLYKSPILQAIREARVTNSTLGNGTEHASAQGGGAGSYSGGSGGGGMAAQSQQFLGDLTPDSPIPFSIPLNGLTRLSSGSYPVSFEVVYADDLKNSHTMIMNGTVVVGRAPQTTGHESKSILDQIQSQIPIPLPVLIGIVIAAIAGAIIAKKLKSKKQRLKMLTGNDTDIVAALDNSDKK